VVRSLIIPKELVGLMSAHANRCLPEEACGLIGGLNGQARLILPVENELHSPVRYRMAPLSQLKAFQKMDENGVELTGIFHSHPNGPAIPSSTDIAEFYYPETTVVILSPATQGEDHGSTAGEPILSGNWQIKGFLIEIDRFVEVQLKYPV
jgi:proteasome lid subunit RPN8/RPN11